MARPGAWRLIAVVAMACDSSPATSPAPPGSAPKPVTGSDSGSAPTGSGSGSGSGSAAAPLNANGLALRAGETLHAGVEMRWVPAGRDEVRVSLVDAEGGHHRVAVWTKDARHDVVRIDHPCMAGQHGAELSTGTKNMVVFRCESETATPGKAVADEWLIRWNPDKEFPTVYRHWRGAREARDAKWAGRRAFYGAPPKEPKEDQCCCQWDNEDLRGQPPSMTSRDYCKGSEDMHGHCVATSKCPVEEGDE